ncbi:DNA-binding response regulator [Dictyobacter alpinus]|uniref:DNA-binding response regulator n=1 Tax=Dictyobacter alpinus TaxID=2014873 RepID=A0A402BFQ8_9CHLR|nr:response regulator transcription factor [Dictyobacter alpinus]GCE30225.1 DNA-binding response regulator [Dictyobacter alpinus]
MGIEIPLAILVVDDDIRLLNALRRTLTYAGYHVTTAVTGKDALNQCRQRPADLVILDRMLPDMDGLEVCVGLRERNQDMAILLLTAKDAIADRVEGLEVGADDYLVKPFAQAELLARIKALLRRRQPPDVQKGMLGFADLGLDTATRLARRGDRSIELSTTEYELLALFMRNPGIVLTRTLLLDRIWGSDFEGGPNVLEVYIAHLRAKLEQAGESRIIQTMRGTGYVLRQPI